MIKLGGSVITDKRTPYKPRTRTIGRISKEIASIVTHFQLGLVHGGGSFGHVSVREVEADVGRLDYRGYYRVTYAMDWLNWIVLSKLVEAKVPAVSLPPRSFCKYSCEKQEYECGMEVVKHTSMRGLIPLLYGDLLLSKGDCAPKVISGDRLVYMMASALNALRVVFVVRAPGILVKEDGKRLIARRVPLSRMDQLIEKAASVSEDEGNVDVTQGMIGKLRAIKEGMESTSVRETIILPSEPPNILLDYLLRGKRDVGTIIYK